QNPDIFAEFPTFAWHSGGFRNPRNRTVGRRVEYAWPMSGPAPAAERPDPFFMERIELMMRLPRFGMAAVCAVALAPAARAAEPDKLLQGEADTVMYVNVKQLLDSDVVKKYALDQIKQALAGQDAKKLLEELGLDPLKDIDTVWGATVGKDQNDMKGLVVVHGKFDPDKLFKAAEAASKKDGDKFSMIKDGGTTMFKFQPDQGNPVYGTVVDETTVVAATDKKLVANALTQKKTAIGNDLAALVKKMDEKSSVF